MKDDLPRLEVEMPDRFEVAGVRTSDGLFEALVDLLPGGSVLYLEGAADADVQAFYEARALVPAVTVPWGTVWPEPSAYHLPVDARTMGDLVHLARDRAEPELCEHLVAYRGEEALLVGYDAFSQPFLLAPSLGEAAALAFGERVDGTVARIPRR